uniref:(California timema) hypothetical protein n=2 Tax=Timema TaxID=61471 RepID=A0A7R9IZH1_TIMCA|nr:unnamed protein product [Timema californicum]
MLPIVSRNGVANSDQEKDDALTEQFESQFVPTDNPSDLVHITHVVQVISVVSYRPLDVLEAMDRYLSGVSHSKTKGPLTRGLRITSSTLEGATDAPKPCSDKREVSNSGLGGSHSATQRVVSSHVYTMLFSLAFFNEDLHKLVFTQQANWPYFFFQVLLMGKSGSGKTSMRSIIFANYIARDTRRLGATIDVEHSHVRFLGNLVLNLWDCGGQEAFMENYFASQRDNIFRNVEVLIYVFDVESRELDKDMHYYQSCLEAILQNSPEAKIFCLVHKMDLVQEDQRDLIFHEREEDLKRLSRPLDCTCFRTSIWDETLYRAWSSIVYMLIPNVKELEQSLNQFANIIDADEVLLFERATFLVISHCQRRNHRDVHRFEKVSNIIKQFKLSCSKLAAQFQSMEVRNSNFAAFIDIFTSNTYVMVIMSDPAIPSEATLINIRNAKKHFEKLERVSQAQSALAK